MLFPSISQEGSWTMGSLEAYLVSGMTLNDPETGHSTAGREQDMVDISFLPIEASNTGKNVTDSFYVRSKLYEVHEISTVCMQIVYHLTMIQRTRGLIQYKDASYQYRKSHCGDKRVVRSSYLHNGISYTGKMASLYWIWAQGAISTVWYKTKFNFGNHL